MTRKPYRYPLLLAVVMMTARQLTGFRAVVTFSTDMFRAAGLSSEESEICTILTGLSLVV